METNQPARHQPRPLPANLLRIRQKTVGELLHFQIPHRPRLLQPRLLLLSQGEQPPLGVPRHH